MAAWLGAFLGEVLAHLAPVIVEILREALKKTVEDGATRDDLRDRLLASVRAHSARTSGGAGAPASSGEGKDLGG